MRLPSGASRAEGRLDITHTTRRRGRTELLRQEPLSRPERTQHTRAGAQEQKRLEDREKDSSSILVDKRGHMQASTIINNKKNIGGGSSKVLEPFQNSAIFMPGTEKGLEPEEN